MSEARTQRQALPYALYLLGRRSYSTADLRTSLLKRYESEETETVIARLKELRLLNDALYADQYVQARQRMRPMGKQRLRLELAQKGVAGTFVDEAMSEHVDELSGAQQALKSAWGRYGRLDPMVRERRSLSFLMRRGFSYEVARKAYTAVLRESGE